METAIEGIVVFRLTHGTHWKHSHGGVGTVVGNSANDGEAGPAIGAIDERIAIAPVSRIEQFAEAIGTDGDIGRDQSMGSAVLAAQDAKLGFISCRDIPRDDAANSREGRSCYRKATGELLNGLRRTLDLNGDAGGCIAHGAG